MLAVPTPPQHDPAAPHDSFRARELAPATVLVAVSGDVDAVAAPVLFDRIERRLAGYSQLVLDLSRVEFFGTAGYSLLHRLDVFCTRTAVDWALVVNPAVSRLLRICDPDNAFPTATNIVSAVATLARGPHRTPQLTALPLLPAI